MQLAIKAFEKAQAGGDEEKYNFALGIQTHAFPENRKIFGDIPRATEDIYRKSLEMCLAVFKDVASRGHEGGAFMVADYARRGICGSTPPASPPKRKSWRCGF